MMRKTANPVDLAMAKVEPDHLRLEADLRQLASYFVTIGSDVNIASDRKKCFRLRKYRLDAASIQYLVSKYQLTYSKVNDISTFGRASQTLEHLAMNYPRIFITQAAALPPGGYEERRFWWCANNRAFYEKYSDKINDSNALKGFATSRLLSDVLYKILTHDEPKLIRINALHLSVKHSEQRVFPEWFQSNLRKILSQMEKDNFRKTEAEEKRRLRKMFRIEEAEKALNTLSVEKFVEWWNLTGLRKPHQASQINQSSET